VKRSLRLLVAPLVLLAAGEAMGADVVILDPVIVTAPAVGSEATDSSLGAVESLAKEDLASRQGSTADAGHLLLEIPGVDLQAAGGLSSLPAIHGLSDDRLRIQVDGAEPVSACPNHMNAPLSYVAPSRIRRVKVFGAVAPVSVGGDSIGGTIRVSLAEPVFASRDQRYAAQAEAGSFYRSDGNAMGYNLAASAAAHWLSLTYAESSSPSDNSTAGGSFKPVSAGREGGRLLAGNEVGSSAYHGATNRSLGLALRRDGHLVQLDLSRQTVDFEGFPNQRMDMTGNDNWLMGLRYTGQFGWGDLVARLGYQDTRHKMDMGSDRYAYGTGMPMDSKAKNRAASIQGNIFVSETSLVRTGVEYQAYTLFDWWPAVGGVMGPNDFWNIDYGRRHKLGLFAEWEGHLKDTLVAQIGVRGDRVGTNAAAVQGYDNGLAGAWGNDAAAFNAKSRQRSDHNWDVTGLLDYSQSYQAGYARKSRTPNLYQRYAWSTNAMAALMNNFLGDGNGYVGNVGLAPEIANTVSLTGHWHDPASKRWRVRATGYYTHIQDYIDARRCDAGQCSDANTATTTGFVLLQYANQSARLYGWDLSGHVVLVEGKSTGRIEAEGVVSYVRGKNLATGDNLYNIMPLHGRFLLGYRLGPWSVSPELVAVARKDKVSHVRNEMQTGAYWLLNLRSSIAWKRLRVDFAVENLLDRLYANPLGGAYLGQGASMTSNGIPWGVVVPGRGRSFLASVGVSH
jgi:iron complex outermembrane receptor protein